MAVLLHGLGENEAAFDRRPEILGTTDADTMRDLGRTPDLLRADTGLALRENGCPWPPCSTTWSGPGPVEVDPPALVGHSMGGLVIRAACAVTSAEGATGRPWADRVTDVVTLGTPHLGAPPAGHVGRAPGRGLVRCRRTGAPSSWKRRPIRLGSPV